MAASADQRVDATEVLSLSAAARRTDSSPQTVRAAFDRGAIRGQRVRRGRGETIVFLVHEFDEDLVELRCRHPGCDRYGLGSSGGCREHANTLAFTGKPRPADVVARCSAAMRGKARPHTRKHAWEHRSCEWEPCSKSLGLVPGWKVKAGSGRFCSKRCAALAQHAPNKAGADITCPTCGDTRYRRPSMIARGLAGYCRDHYAESPDFRRVLRVNHARLEQRWLALLEQRKAAEGVLDTADVAGILGLAPATVQQLAAALKPVRFDDGRRHLYDPAVIKRARIELAHKRRPPTHRRTVELQAAQLVRRGAPDNDDTRSLAAQIVQRRWDAVKGHRGGRSRSDGPSLHDLALRTRVDEVLQRLQFTYAQRKCDHSLDKGERPPSQRQAAEVLALEESYSVAGIRSALYRVSQYSAES